MTNLHQLNTQENHKNTNKSKNNSNKIFIVDITGYNFIIYKDKNHKQEYCDIIFLFVM